MFGTTGGIKLCIYHYCKNAGVIHVYVNIYICMRILSQYYFATRNDTASESPHADYAKCNVIQMSDFFLETQKPF